MVYKTIYSAGADLKPMTFTIEPGKILRIPLGIELKDGFDKGYFCDIRERSSAFVMGLLCRGVIDPDYPKEWVLMVRNISNETISVKNKSVAQVLYLKWDRFPDADVEFEIREGGLGSTDANKSV